MSITDGGEPAYQQGAGFLLSRLGAMAERAWSRFIAAAGLTQTEFTVLAVLTDGATHRQFGLAHRAAVDPRNLVACVRQLTARGLVTAEPDPADRRGKLIRISAEGTALLAGFGSELAPQREEFFAPLSPEQYTELCALLDAVYQHQLRQG